MDGGGVERGDFIEVLSLLGRCALRALSAISKISCLALAATVAAGASAKGAGMYSIVNFVDTATSRYGVLSAPSINNNRQLVFSGGVDGMGWGYFMGQDPVVSAVAIERQYQSWRHLGMTASINTQ